MRWRHPLVAYFASVFRTTREASGAVKPTLAPSEEEVRSRQALQALNQQQTVFEQRRAQDEAAFRLERAMGWATFVIVPVSVAMALIEPLTLTAFGPVSALAFWNWRRLLAREPHELTPTTPGPSRDRPDPGRGTDDLA